jgi:glycosyltransferase involved in cell wall biosynthesis
VTIASVNCEETSPSVSICVPIFIRDTKILSFFAHLLHSIESQSYKDFEVVIAGDSESLAFLNSQGVLEKSFLGEKAKVFLSTNLGISLNTNFVISHAKGNLIKIMYQDDFFADDSSLEEIVFALRKTRRRWLVSASGHWDEESSKFGQIMIPKLSKELFIARNTISSPSVVALKRKYYEPFSSDLELMLDCEWYVRMTHMHGRPKTLNKVSVINRLHKEQAQHRLRKKVSYEIKIMENMHNFKGMRKARKRCKCESRN